MQIEITEFIADKRGCKIGNVDFVLTYSPTKNETFRNVAFFEKGEKKWLAVASTKRDEEWFSTYERTPSLKITFHEVIKVLLEDPKYKLALNAEKHLF